MNIYYKVTEVTDFGPYVTKLILPVKRKIRAFTFNLRTFSVYVERKDKHGDILMLPKGWFNQEEKVASRGFCEIKDAYPSCAHGERADDGEFVTLELYSKPLGLTSEVAAANGMNEYVVSCYRITQIEDIDCDGEKISGLVFDQCAGNIMPQIEGFRHARSSNKENPIQYGYYVPQTVQRKLPLIIWLHGGGEGGSDPLIAFAGNKVVNLASEQIQNKFGGAVVLVPQCPTYWMDDGIEKLGRSGKTIYGKALKEVIDEFISKNEAFIDRKRIYIGGCSNGGFMTMRMLIDESNFFAAAFPICEALYNETISDIDIDLIKETPIWFIHSQDDTVVKPDETAVPTYHRLIEAGAPDVHFSYYEKVVDIHDLFKDENGEPYTYHGHFSWIYALNDDCNLDFDGTPVVVNGEEVSLMTWLALHTK